MVTQFVGKYHCFHCYNHQHPTGQTPDIIKSEYIIKNLGVGSNTTLTSNTIGRNVEVDGRWDMNAGSLHPDNVQMLLGNSSDARILFDGTNFVLRANAVGSGFLQVKAASLFIPHLTAIPTITENGMIWMESDGLHFFSNGGETIIAGV